MRPCLSTWKFHNFDPGYSASTCWGCVHKNNSNDQAKSLIDSGESFIILCQVAEKFLAAVSNKQTLKLMIKVKLTKGDFLICIKI